MDIEEVTLLNVKAENTENVSSMVCEDESVPWVSSGTIKPLRKASDLQYCAKVMQAKCASFVLCSRDFSTKVCAKVRMKFHGVLSDNSLEQRKIFL